MTGSRDFKRLVRKRMAETGESYTVARSHFDELPKKTASRKPSAAPTTVAAFKKKVYARRGTKELGAHLEEHYGIRVSQTTKLDVGVHRIDRGGDPSWIARIFPAARSVDAANGDAEILSYLEQQDFPSERTAHPEPMSTLAGQPVLVTEFAPGSNRRSDESEEAMQWLGTLLGRLNSLPDGLGACARPAGSWHHLSVNGGGRRSDVEVLLTLLDDTEGRLSIDERPLMRELRGELEALDDLEDLPKALIHPDPCGANLIALGGDEGVLVDWTGAGRGPRVGAFANLISSVTALTLIDAAVAGYRCYATLDERELDRLEAALVGFPLILDCWTHLFQGAPLSMLMKRWTIHQQRARALAERARSAFAAPPPTRATAKSEENQASLF